MIPNDTACTEPAGNQNQSVVRSSQRRYSYTKVLDKRKSPIRGLWKRNGKFYARITTTDPHTDKKVLRWVYLMADTVPAAQAELRKLLTQRDSSSLPVLQRTPKFSDYVREYLSFYSQATGFKRASTMATEKIHLNHWTAFLGETCLDKITLPRIRDFIAQKQSEGWTARTVNLSITCLRNVLKRGIEDGWLQRLPIENLRPLKVIRAERKLVNLEQIEKLCEAAMTFQNGQEFTDYIRLMAFCGSRRNETLRLKWTDVDWERRQLTVGSDGLTKNGKTRVVDFNDKLEAHLKVMLSRRAPDSVWLFPSPRRGETDQAAKTFMETLRRARQETGFLRFGFHDLRHYFISFAVMSGIDYMTIARWVGHQDGGILIGKVYGHLSAEHAQRQARRMVFESNAIKHPA